MFRRKVAGIFCLWSVLHALDTLRMLLSWLQKQFPAIIEQVKFTSNVVLEMEKAGFERTYVVWRKHKADLLFVPVKPGDRLELGTVEAINKSTCLSRVGQFCDETQKKALMNG